MSRVQIFPNQNVQEIFAYNKVTCFFFAFNIANIVQTSASANLNSKTSEKRIAHILRRYTGQRLLTIMVE